MRDFMGKFVFCCLGVWISDHYLAGLQIGGTHDRWPMKVALLLGVGLLMATVDRLMKPTVQMLHMPTMVLTIMLVWAVVGTFALWLVAQLAHALQLPMWLTHLRWDALVAALIIGGCASLMEYVTTPQIQPVKKF